MQLAHENTAAGVTRDFEFTPTTAGFNTFDVATIFAGKPTERVVTVPIRVQRP